MNSAAERKTQGKLFNEILKMREALDEEDKGEEKEREEQEKQDVYIYMTVICSGVDARDTCVSKNTKDKDNYNALQ